MLSCYRTVSVVFSFFISQIFIALQIFMQSLFQVSSVHVLSIFYNQLLLVCSDTKYISAAYRIWRGSTGGRPECLTNVKI